MKLIHDNETIIGLLPSDSTAKIHTGKTVFEGTKEECIAEASRLSLFDPHGHTRPAGTSAPPATRNSQLAAKFFESQPEKVKETFGEVFRIVSGLKNDADKLTIIEAIAVPTELAEAKAAIMSRLVAMPAIVENNDGSVTLA